MTPQAIETREAARLRAFFAGHGAMPVETGFLQPAGTLLDLYGEGIRARAYVTSDALRGEQMLRPDFTVPVVQMHMAHGAAPARYTYAGPVFRRQEEDAARANEYQQVGFELFDGTNPAEADAEVFCLIAQALGPAPLRAATGDIGILLAAVDALETTAPRRAALRRHIWRPRRFRALMDRFSGRAPVPASRQAVIAGQLAPSGAPEIGLRSMAEVEARIAALREDAQAGPIPASQVALIDAILDVREAMPYALEQLRDISVDLPAIVPAVARMAQRMQALERRGIDVARLDFEASYGRSTMEYYDGFVFGFYAETRADLPAVASGGRYDALTAVLGQGRSIPAVGGVIRPGLLAELGAGE